MNEIYIGLMSGTSLDGVDGVLVDFGPQDGGRPLQVLAHAALPFEAGFRAELLALNTPGPDELHRAALAGNRLARAYAQVVGELLACTGIDRAQVRAIGAHGQTVRHRPQEFDGTGYTIQLLQPALLAELTGIPVAADFRSRDVAAGGHGAPLAPAFHQALFGAAREVAVLNIGGIANLTLLRPGQPTLGFDCGPGNVLMDLWCARHLGRPYDEDGRWAAGGQAVPSLLDALLQEPWLALPPPKSTGRDLFNESWLEARLGAAPDTSPADVQATLCEFTACAVVRHLQRHAPGVAELVVCGGGARNGHLMARLAARLPGVQVVDSGRRGLPPLQVEAAAFAWLARQRVLGAPGNLPAVTGAAGERVLGALHAA
ncbi:anhydro-N-acetylmuramic acid kinase [Caldimonas thermodepolymerans]|uniref:Anhydro-N-acetylmuramic acid kinase n=1 Tax=Caldimonas thermodepolymerans TaxID=215580 RepID=A0A2S5T648_9BURK|nr:anhydro-N-acetylmuramic acid kinase [Caldimonas thermodepolymerans]PPE70475.1 anhydro-N-acetylmuramic acid kinase [Caldimonas thermodepolymerans]QPC31142.1 anhydro-N-acetylmuramic acid kinase [Caldimonas thermodepolymerans]RDH96599.1 anhydro-N-acetylmuramic acid kinase [Caldimonas thermodepolymerans]TCP04802.1 anhydro-N-acetylmuramic acid kinase [Caldimonas thermodepolymerans]UZG47540.1 anhydro-N-acetylmuramic acid kinase [Caldimonas thermodepolymerans]